MSRLKKSSTSFKFIITAFLLNRALIYLVAIFSLYYISKGHWYSAPETIVDLFSQWDSGWYANIATKGYSIHPGHQSSVVFFPLYPLLMWLFSFGIFDIRLIGFIISNISLLIGSIIFVKLIEKDTTSNVAQLCLIMLLFFPMSFFFSAVYTESLFFLMSVTCIYFARERKWAIASFFGMLTALTRSVGVLLFILLLFEYLRISYKDLSLKNCIYIIKKKIQSIRVDFCWLFLVPLGLILYMTYLYITFGNPFAFMEYQQFWGRSLSIPFAGLFSPGDYGQYMYILHASVMLCNIAILVYLIIKKFRLSYVVYFTLLILAPASSNLLYSYARYALGMIPFFIGLGLYFEKKRISTVSVLILLTYLLILSTIQFVNGYFMI